MLVPSDLRTKVLPQTLPGIVYPVSVAILLVLFKARTTLLGAEKFEVLVTTFAAKIPESVIVFDPPEDKRVPEAILAAWVGIFAVNKPES
jgi:hypothetical protein